MRELHFDFMVLKLLGRIILKNPMMNFFCLPERPTPASSALVLNALLLHHQETNIGLAQPLLLIDVHRNALNAMLILNKTRHAALRALLPSTLKSPLHILAVPLNQSS
jgi:hypothetical protein